MSMDSDLKAKIRIIPNFPKEGISFIDITTLLMGASEFRRAVDDMAELWQDEVIDKVVCIEARGFLLGSALAYRLDAGLVPVRKRGKLPSDTISASYDLEYGSDVIEIHTDSVGSSDRVLIVDDLIATGGTALSAARLLKHFGCHIVGACFLVDISTLDGSKKLIDNGINVKSLLTFNEF
jgi:adenine phosphoribosyltransferase